MAAKKVEEKKTAKVEKKGEEKKVAKAKKEVVEKVEKKVEQKTEKKEASPAEGGRVPKGHTARADVAAQASSRKGSEAPIVADKKTALEDYKIVIHPLITEKSINLIEAENKLVFVVAKHATKLDVKKAVEELYGVRVDKVNLLRDTKSRKKAFVRISKDFKAGDIATRLGVL